MPHANALAEAGGIARLKVPLGDGTGMSVAVSGEGPDLLLVHGWSAHAGFFEDVQHRLADRFRVIAPDLRAHGATPRGTAPLTIRQLADDLNRMFEALAVRDAVVSGWSMGAMVLWRMMADHGAQRIAGLIVEDMSPRILNDHAWTLGMSNGIDASTSQRACDSMRANWMAYAEAFAPRMFARDSRHRLGKTRDWVVGEFAAHDGDAMADLWTSMAAEDARPILPELKLPVRVIHGALSEAYSPETSRFLVETLPDAEVVSFARSGHAPHLEEPERFSSAVAEFADRVQPAGGHKNPTSSEGSKS
ncbi:MULTISPECIES: alpha/beta fold hydrolase [Hyphobacterium]|uniref:Alpha/beta fold hydrolase n=1 Tax=Hyphobacterium vulgare TaxID=1736751 RepID=A0ABV7A0Y1_9PROT